MFYRPFRVSRSIELKRNRTRQHSFCVNMVNETETLCKQTLSYVVSAAPLDETTSRICEPWGVMFIWKHTCPPNAPSMKTNTSLPTCDMAIVGEDEDFGNCWVEAETAARHLSPHGVLFGFSITLCSVSSAFNSRKAQLYLQHYLSPSSSLKKPVFTSYTQYTPRIFWRHSFVLLSLTIVVH